MKYPTKYRRYPFKRQLSRKLRKIAFMAVAVAITVGYSYYDKNYSNKTTTEKSFELKKATKFDTSPYGAPNKHFPTSQYSLDKLKQAQKNPQLQPAIVVKGTVIKLLKDDLDGSRHQKFIIRVTDNITLLVAHNIDLAERVALRKGDTVSVSGIYEWNNRGGVIHWTHHDPKGKNPGGWIRANGKNYR